MIDINVKAVMSGEGYDVKSKTKVEGRGDCILIEMLETLKHFDKVQHGEILTHAFELFLKLKTEELHENADE